jgi:hypothetical protein
MPPVKGPGVLLRLYSSSSFSQTAIEHSLDVPGADIKSLTTLRSTDDKVVSGSPSANILYEVKHISKLLIPGAYEKDTAHNDGTTTSLNWQVYKLISKISRPGTEDQVAPSNSTMVCIGITPMEGAFEDYSKWYEEEHLGLLSLVPGWRSSARYELAASFGGPKVVAPYIAMHFYDEVNGLGGPEWKRSVETDWTKKVRRNCAVPHFRRVWSVESQQIL